MTRALIGLGSNLGDRLAMLAEALRLLDADPGVRVVAASRAYESEPWGVVEQPAFANAVAVLDTELTPHELLALCKRIEADMGRVKVVRYGPRAIDLDVLTYGDLAVDDTDLTIPHPRLLERDFVVTPLLEVAPDTVLPDGRRPSSEAATEGRVVGVLGEVRRP